MKQGRSVFSVLILGVLFVASHSPVMADGVIITPSRQITTPNYEATIAADGTMPSLIVNGQQLLKSGISISRGIYLYQDGPLKLPQIEQTAENVITAKGDKATIRYEFAPNSITATIANSTGNGMPYVMVLDPNFHMVMNDAGDTSKTILNQPSTSSTWVADKARVKISGSENLWGPWENLQILQASVAGHETRKVVWEIGATTNTAVPVPAAPDNGPVATGAVIRPTEPSPIKWDMAQLAKSPQTFPAPGMEVDGVESLFYEGPTWRGKPTRVFAYIGMPVRKANEKVPAMVLVHGGGGTAFADWVKLWTSRGYAAIAMDTTGSIPKDNRPVRHEMGGPPGWGGFDRITEDVPEDQWTYQAVSDVILANSLLRSRPEVDANRIGITGISWGGYLTCIATSTDNRFKLAVPVYGCGFLGDNSVWVDTFKGMGVEKAKKWLTLWDPSQYLPKAKMPFLWVDGTNDVPYPLDSLQKTYRLLPKNQRELTTIVRMPHAHGGPGENPEEIHGFANHYLKNEAPLAHIVEQKSAGNQVTVAYQSPKPIVRAELNFTKDSGSWIERNWETVPAQLDGTLKIVKANIPSATTVYYVNIIDDRNLIVSSEHVEIQPVR